MRICILLPYANPHDTGWIDQFISNSDHEIVVGIVNSVKKYRSNHFEDADSKNGYLYFFKGKHFKKLFYEAARKSDCLITLGIFEPWFLNTILCIPKIQMIYVLSEPLRPGNARKLLLRKCYMNIIRIVKKSSKFSFLCIGGILVKKQYCTFGFQNSRFYHFGHFPMLQLAKKKLESKNPEIKFIFVGQLIPRKGIDILISTIKYLKGKYSNWRFMIIGDGILKNELLQACEKEERIHYIKNIEDANIMKAEFDSNHVLFLPSYFDGWGAVVNEALSSCCSLLLSENVYAGVELLSDRENGFKFNPYYLNELYNALDKYFENPEILNSHFQKSMQIFEEWNHKNAATSFNNILGGKINHQNKTLLRVI
ncbi:MAG: glycosyltransferase [Ginsengibacter sp.]